MIPMDPALAVGSPMTGDLEISNGQVRSGNKRQLQDEVFAVNELQPIA